jgi:hypothetical protein
MPLQKSGWRRCQYQQIDDFQVDSVGIFTAQRQ